MTYYNKILEMFAYTEKGEVRKLRKTRDLFDITYWIISNQVFKAALKYATKQADEKQDFRRALFEKELELLGILGEEYFKKKKADIHEILINHPFNDDM